MVVALCVVAFGGSARYDAWQLLVLQPVCIAGLTLFAWRVRQSGTATGFALPIWLLVALAGLMLLQLMPLPQAIWSALPGRGVLVDIQTALGWDNIRPLSLVPTRTLNALFGLSVPALALFAFIALDPARRRVGAIGAVILIAVVSAAFGALQLIGPSQSAMYLYEISNFGQAVGLFANSNHAAIFGSLALVVIGYCIVAALEAGRIQQILALLAIFGLVFVMVILSGSRLGLGTAAIALLSTGASYLVQRSRHAVHAKRPVRIAIAAGFVGSILALAALFFLADQIPALGQLMNEGPMEDLRVRILGTLLEMTGGYFPAGSGIGSFENVYYIVEPDDELRPSYLNMAHNDWLQYLIETGLPGIALLAGAFWWIVRTGLALARDPANRPVLVAFIAGVLVVALASLFDYPLRVPLFQAACVLLLICTADFARTRVATEAG